MEKLIVTSFLCLLSVGYMSAQITKDSIRYDIKDLKTKEYDKLSCIETFETSYLCPDRDSIKYGVLPKYGQCLIIKDKSEYKKLVSKKNLMEDIDFDKYSLIVAYPTAGGCPSSVDICIMENPDDNRRYLVIDNFSLCYIMAFRIITLLVPKEYCQNLSDVYMYKRYISHHNIKNISEKDYKRLYFVSNVKFEKVLNLDTCISSQADLRKYNILTRPKQAYIFIRQEEYIYRILMVKDMIKIENSDYLLYPDWDKFGFENVDFDKYVLFVATLPCTGWSDSFPVELNIIQDPQKPQKHSIFITCRKSDDNKNRLLAIRALIPKEKIINFSYNIYFYTTE